MREDMNELSLEELDAVTGGVGYFNFKAKNNDNLKNMDPNMIISSSKTSKETKFFQNDNSLKA